MSRCQQLADAALEVVLEAIGPVEFEDPPRTARPESLPSFQAGETFAQEGEWKDAATALGIRVARMIGNAPARFFWLPLPSGLDATRATKRGVSLRCIRSAYNISTGEYEHRFDIGWSQ